MKKITIILILLTGAINYAQTKEETVGFIAKYMRESIGIVNSFWDKGEKVSDFWVEDIVFNENRIFSKEQKKRYDLGGTFHINEEYTKIEWANVKKIYVDSLKQSLSKENVEVFIMFTSKVKKVRWCEGGSINYGCSSTDYVDYISLLVPRNRGLSCERALKHLVEIFKEQDKDDPFSK